MGDEQFDEYGQIIQEGGFGQITQEDESYLDSIMMENQGSVVLTYDSNEEYIGSAEKEQFTKAVQVIEDSGRAEIEDVTYIEDVVAGEGSITAVVYTEDVDEVQNFVEPAGQGPELAVKRINYDMDISEEVESYLDQNDDPIEGMTEALENLDLKNPEEMGLPRKF